MPSSIGACYERQWSTKMLQDYALRPRNFVSLCCVSDLRVSAYITLSGSPTLISTIFRLDWSLAKENGSETREFGVTPNCWEEQKRKASRF
jgi:hypothetical protein